MEKPGMGRRYRCLRAGLLTILLCAALPPQEARSAGDDNMALSVQTSPETLEAGMPWTITILADHPLPGEVQVLPPEFPDTLTLEQVSTLPWLTETGERWTSIEYRFIPRRGGVLFIGSFEVLTPEKRAFTPAMVLEVHGIAGEAPVPTSPPRLRWALPSAQLQTGEPAEFRLLVIPANTAVSSRAASGLAGTAASGSVASTYHPLLPENAILEVFPPELADRRSGGAQGPSASDPQVLLRLRVIPLNGSFLTIKPAELTMDGQTIPVPGLEIPVHPAPALHDASRGFLGIPGRASSDPAPPTPEVFSVPLPPLPAAAAVFYPFRPAYEKALNAAGALWSTGQAAQALALLRQNERNLLSGPAIAVTRRAAEALLQLGPTPDEPWRPRILGLAGSLLAALTLLVLLLRLKLHYFPRILPAQTPPPKPRKIFSTVTAGIPWGFRIVIIILILLTSLGFYGFIERTPGPNRPSAPQYRSVKGRAVVLRAGDVYRVPDIGAADRRSTDFLFAETRFREGESARIREAAENWVYVETPEGKAGWTPADRVILY